MLKFSTRRIKKAEKEFIPSLEQFIQQFYWGEHLTISQAERNLNESLVEITYYGEHSSNGLLITENGYFLTAKHCVTGKLRGMKIKLHNERVYSIERVCAISNKDDIALAKARIDGENRSKNYKFYNSENLKKMPITLMTRREGELNNKYGFIEEKTSVISKGLDNIEYLCQNAISSVIESKPGDSGGIIVSTDRRLLGFNVSASNEKASAVVLNKALELVVFYISRIKQR